MAKIVRYEVFNRITGRAATAACDRMDNAYGSCICTRRAIWSDANG
jgi:hypothetical protein